MPHVKIMNYFVKVFLLVFNCLTLYIEATAVSGQRGLSVILTCSFRNDDTTPPTITWIKEPNILVAQSVSGFSHISGTLSGRAKLNGGNLTIDNLLISDAGSYTCNVIAVGSLQESTIIQLNVSAKPAITSFSIPTTTLDIDGMYSPALCRANKGKPAARIEWTDLTGKIQISRITETLQPDGSHNVESKLLLYPGLDGQVFNSSKKIIETKMFRCHVIHDDVNDLEAWRNVDVQLMFPPVAHISLFANNLTCHVTGHPTPKVTWFIPSDGQIENQNSILIGPTGNGRYTCLGSNGLKPDSFATIDMQKARDLPTLFRTHVSLNTSVPVTASGYIIQCEADVVGISDNLAFIWLKNDNIINDTEKEYVIQTSTKNEGFDKRITSSLIFKNITQGRDDAIFSCRMTNSSKITGLVTAVERSISITVDYPPKHITIQSDRNTSISNSTWAVENTDLILNCKADMRPEGTFEWYYKDQKIATGQTLQLSNIQRSQSGFYKCMAYNYVPGSLSRDISVSVHYPPSRPIVSESGANEIVCLTHSYPEPIYKWIYPNGSHSLGNHSVLKVREGDGKFHCFVYNYLGSSNISFALSSFSLNRIAGLSKIEFSLTVAVCAFVGLLLTFVVLWMVFRRRSKQKSADVLSTNDSLNCYLEYPEPPAPGLNKFYTTPVNLQTEDHQANFDLKSKDKCKNIQDIRYVECKSSSNIADKSVDLFNTNFTRTNSKPDGNGKAIFSSNEVDGSSIEVIENDSVSLTEKNASLVFARDEAHTLENSNVLCSPSRMQRIRQEVAMQMYSRTSVQPYHQSTFPKSYCKPPLPLYMTNQDTLAPGYDPRLYDDTWRLPMSRYSSEERGALPYATLRMHSCKKSIPTSSVTSVTFGDSSNFSEDFMCGVKRPRSMSLSGTCSSNDSSVTNSSVTNTENVIAQKDRGSSLNPSPFDSGNDSVKSVRVTPTCKKQSHTLV